MLKHALGPTRPLLGDVKLNSLCYCNPAAPRSILTGLTAQHCANYPAFCHTHRTRLDYSLIYPPNWSQLTLACPLVISLTYPV